MTAGSIGASIQKSSSSAHTGLTGPVARLKALAHTYLDFARANVTLWRGLFDHHLAGAKEIPEEHRQENIALLAFIGREIKTLEPAMDDAALAARTRTCFAAVHGLVTISLEDRFIGLSEDTLPVEMDFLVDRLAGR